MKFNRAFLAAAPFLISPGVALALPPPSPPASGIQQLQNSQQQQIQLQTPPPDLRVGTNAPELYSGENSDIGPQRILQIGPNGKATRRKYFDVTLDTQLFYTDNANYGPQPRISSWVFVNTVAAAIAPDAYDLGGGKFAPSVGFSSQWYNYNDARMSPLDFDAQSAFANFRYLKGNWQFNLGANFTRLQNQNNSTGHGTYTDSYREWLPNANAQRAIPLNDNMSFIIGDVVDYHVTWAPIYFSPSLVQDDANDHFDNILFLTFNWQVTPHLVLQPFYRFDYAYYPDRYAPLLSRHSTRNDYMHSVGLNVIYTFNQYVSARAFYNYNTKYTDDPSSQTYDEMNGGVGATLDFRF